MTGIKEAFREYILLMKYNPRKILILIFLVIISAVLGKYFSLVLFVALFLTSAFFIPESPADQMLPLSDREIRILYLSRVWVKVIHVLFFFMINLVIGMIWNLGGYRDLFRENPFMVVLFSILTVLFSTFFFLTTMNSSMRLFKSLFYEGKRSVPVLIGRIGCVLYGVVLLLVCVTLLEFQGLIDSVLIVTDTILLLIGVVGILSSWKISKR